MIIEFYKHAMTTLLGRDHVATQAPCQDATYFNASHGVRVLVVSDGAGSRKYSELGSQIITEALGQLLPQVFQKILLKLEENGKTKSQSIKDRDWVSQLLLDQALEKLQLMANKKRITVDDMAATMLLIAFNQDYYISAHIGDGLICGIQQEKGLDFAKIISLPEGEANETFFLTGKNAKDHLRIHVGKMIGIKGFFLTTDGIQDKIYEKKLGLIGTLNPLIRKMKGNTSEEFLHFFNKLIQDKWVDAYDDIGINIIYRDQWLFQQSSKEKIIPYLNNIASKEQIIKKSPYAFFIDETIHYHNKDFYDPLKIIELISQNKL